MLSPLLLEQAILTLAALVLFTSFVMLMQTRLIGLIHTLAWQGALLTLTTLLMAILSGYHALYISAVLTLSLKTLFIPWFLHRLVLQLNIRRKIEVVGPLTGILLGAALLVLLSYEVILPIRASATYAGRNIIAITIAVILLGILLIMTRRKAVAHVVGFMAMENGLFFAAIVSTYGMPMIVELGIAFDVLVATLLFGVSFFHLRTNIDSLNTDDLRRLREDDNA